MERWSGIIDKTFEDPSNVLDDDAGDIVMVTSMPLKFDCFNAFGLLVKTSHFRIVIGCDWILLQWSVLRALGKLPKKTVFFGISFPNLFTYPPTPGFL